MNQTQHPPVDLFARSEVIKAEYLNSGCEASNVDESVLRLMEECGELFEDNQAARGFLMDETHEEKENPNENCLEGFQCPTCGSYGPFRIWTTKAGEVVVHDDGTEEDQNSFGDTIWSDEAGCRCCDCGNSGTVREFNGEPAPEFNTFQQIAANTYDGGEHFCKSPDSINTCGDSLLAFVMNELSTSEDCDSIGEAISRIKVAIRQLEEVSLALEAVSVSKTMQTGV